MFKHTNAQGKSFAAGKHAALRLSGIGALSLALMACGSAPQAPGAAEVSAQPVQAQMCPIEPESAQTASARAATAQALPSDCTPPDPDPDPDPTPAPDPQPAPPVFSVTPDPGRPELTPEMAQALQAAGMTNPYDVGQTYTGACNVALYAPYKTIKTTTCTITAPAGTVLRSAQYPSYVPTRPEITSQRKCSWSETLLADGGNVKTRTEIDDIYGRAIDAALKVGNVELGAKLGQMRQYHLQVIELSSDRAIVHVVFTAEGDQSFWSRHKGGNCNGKYWADFIAR